MQLGVCDAARAELGGRAGGGQAARHTARRKVVPEGNKSSDVLAHRLHARRPIADLLEAEERLEVLGHVDQTTTVYAREECDPPFAQRVDEREVPTDLLERGFGTAACDGAHGFSPCRITCHETWARLADPMTSGDVPVRAGSLLAALTTALSDAVRMLEWSPTPHTGAPFSPAASLYATAVASAPVQ